MQKVLRLLIKKCKIICWLNTFDRYCILYNIIEIDYENERFNKTQYYTLNSYKAFMIVTSFLVPMLALAPKSSCTSHMSGNRSCVSGSRWSASRSHGLARSLACSLNLPSERSSGRVTEHDRRSRGLYSGRIAGRYAFTTSVEKQP